MVHVHATVLPSAVLGMPLFDVSGSECAGDNDECFTLMQMTNCGPLTPNLSPYFSCLLSSSCNV